MKIIKENSKEWEKKEGYSKKILLSEGIIKENNSLVQLIKISPGEVAENHYHKKQAEIFYFLNDNGYWIINGKKFVFQIGDTLLIEPEDMHRIVNNTEKPYIYLCFKLNYLSNDLYWEEKDE